MTNLGAAIAAYQQKFDVEGRTLANDIGISESTLTRIKQGKMLDANGLSRIVVWFLQRQRKVIS